MKTWFRKLSRGSRIALVVLAVTVVGAAAWGAFTARAQMTFAVAPADMALTTPWTCAITGAGTCIASPTNGNVVLALANIQNTSVVHIAATFKNVSAQSRCGSIVPPAAQPGMQLDTHAGTVAGPVAPNAFVSASFDLLFVGLTVDSTLTPIEIPVTWVACP